MNLSLRGWLAVVAALLLAANIGWRWYSNWGLVTLDANRRPLSEVIREIEHQAHVTVATNLDPNTPVTLRLEKAPINSALEHLAVVTSARWRLGYALAPDRAKLRAAVESWQAGGNPDDLHWFDAPLGFAMDFLQDTNIPPDPRTGIWNVKPAADNHLQAYLDEGSRDVEPGRQPAAGFRQTRASGAAPGEGQRRRRGGNVSADETPHPRRRVTRERR